MVTIVTMMIVMAVDADAHADGTNINTDDGGVGDARTQQGQGKNRSDKGFHNSSLSRDANSASFAGLGVDGNVAVMESRKTIFRSNSYTLAILPNIEGMRRQSPVLPKMHRRDTPNANRAALTGQRS
jgi:hypothetical protein